MLEAFLRRKGWAKIDELPGEEVGRRERQLRERKTNALMKQDVEAWNVKTGHVKYGPFCGSLDK
jgi:hypothetical protein